MQVKNFPANTLSPEHNDACHALWSSEWPPNPDSGRTRDPAVVNPQVGHTLLIAPDDSVAAVCAWIDRTIQVNGREQRVAGLAGVVVAPQYRGGGNGASFLREGAEWMASLGFEWAVLFCIEQVRGFYERIGWQLLEGGVSATYFGETRPVAPETLVMALPLTPSAAAQWEEWRGAPVYVGVGQW